MHHRLVVVIRKCCRFDLLFSMIVLFCIFCTLLVCSIFLFLFLGNYCMIKIEMKSENVIKINLSAGMQNDILRQRVKESLGCLLPYSTHVYTYIHRYTPGTPMLEFKHIHM